jgi:hypothetical protein
MTNAQRITALEGRVASLEDVNRRLSSNARDLLRKFDEAVERFEKDSRP